MSTDTSYKVAMPDISLLDLPDINATIPCFGFDSDCEHPAVWEVYLECPHKETICDFCKVQIEVWLDEGGTVSCSLGCPETDDPQWREL